MSRLSPVQRSNLQWKVRDWERLAGLNSKGAARARREAHTLVWKLYEYQWGAQFYTGTLAHMAEGMARNVPDLQARVDRLTASADVQERTAAGYLRKALVLQRQLDKDARPRWQAPGLWVLLRVCLQGWLAARGKRC